MNNNKGLENLVDENESKRNTKTKSYDLSSFYIIEMLKKIAYPVYVLYHNWYERRLLRKNIKQLKKQMKQFGIPEGEWKNYTGGV